MKRLKNDWIYILIIAITFGYLAYSAYVFYMADCTVAKSNWLLVEAPGRCL